MGRHPPVLFGSSHVRSLASAVHRSARSGKVDLLYGMKQLGYQMAVKDYNGRFATHVAAEEGQLEALRVLTGLGCPIEEKEDEGKTRNTRSTKETRKARNASKTVNMKGHKGRQGI